MSAATRNARWSLDDWNVTAGWVKTYPVGRVCDCGCGTVLSKFNASSTCEAHQPAPDYLSYLGVKFAACDCCDKLDVAAKAFRRLPDGGRSTTCLSCEQKQKRAADKTARLQTERAKLRVGVVRGCLRMVKCCDCGAMKPATSDNFTIRPDGRRCSTCLVCERKRSNDRYYIKTYGMTRAEYRGDS